ncbi:MAG: GAF and ANTAR domain-containing protein [Nocardioides sp.]
MDGPEDRRRRVLRLVQDAHADRGLEGLAADLQRVCRAARDALVLRGAAVHLMVTDNGAEVAAASDHESRAVAELQFTTNEGPAMVAFRTRRPVLAPRLDALADRWPGFASLAAEQGVRGLFAFPLQEGAVSFGVLELYAEGEGALDADGRAMGAAFARSATDVILDGRAVTQTGELDSGLGASFVDRARIHQAQGMVMVDLGITLGEALTRMRARAFATEVTLLQVADAVLAGLLTAEAWKDGDGSPNGLPT